MSLLNNVVLNIYSIIILLIISVNAIKFFEKESLQDQIYLMLIYSTIMLLFVDILSRLDGNTHTFFPTLNLIGNFLMFLMNPIIPSLWVAYVHLYVYNDEKKTRQLIYPLCFVNLINIVMVIISNYFGWFYYIDANNIYHRGEYFIFSALIIIFLILVSLGIILTNYRKLDRKSFFSLIFFKIPPTISIYLQIKFYGTSLVLNSVVLSLLVVFLNIQNYSMYTDHLTEIYNRKKLDVYLNKKIKSSTMEKGFSAIMLDINNFKKINDTYGHNIGDEALENAAKLLKSCLRSNDFIARFGGDEFCIILDISNKDDLEAMVCRINNTIENYNKNKTHLYTLEFSIGYAVYDKKLFKGAEDFLYHIDTLMYQQKQLKHLQCINKKGVELFSN